MLGKPSLTGEPAQLRLGGWGQLDWVQGGLPCLAVGLGWVLGGFRVAVVWV